MQSEHKERRAYLIDVLNTALARDYLSKSSMQDLIEFLERDVSWKKEVMEALLQCGAYRDELEFNPKKAVKELLRQECLMILDPLISLEAQNLIRAEREACLAICLRRSKTDSKAAIGAYQCAKEINKREKL
jgi:hypothetical protein